ncbi:Fe-S cluster assembly ATPase SufC [Thermosphaera aggregans]|jgi:Fe-S cluster assembly ATP-binding protein|uniref:FeS assembly ATPase SufC n=1 Tax=Thermosphaera aggregans (strain DSM 11486 / M11TL) TaxID=633148 RepID=D5U369_THEAM|nr:Fe-S cluster assembly ATPase SufC [Thermosphaera aggregans]ADG91569.1 FeS assembly ATPase SufC [Thermosphaera aggregans DSM 11486]
MLEVKDLVVEVSERRVVNGVSFKVDAGELAVIMGPNGSGKSSLAYAIMGHPQYKVVSGSVIIDGVDYTSRPTHERALAGVFLGFQNPVEIPGVNLYMLLRSVLNKKMGRTDISEYVEGLEKRVRNEAILIGLKEELLERDLNMGFSGGEKKRSEILQARVIRPKYIILDEPDSGLDVDGVRSVADYIKEALLAGSSIILITHYPRVVEYVSPSKVYVMYRGRFVAEGGLELIDKINREGYRWLEAVGVESAGT